MTELSDEVEAQFASTLGETLGVDKASIIVYGLEAVYEDDGTRRLAVARELKLRLKGYKILFYVNQIAAAASSVITTAMAGNASNIAAAIAATVSTSSATITRSLATSAAFAAALNISTAQLASAVLKVGTATLVGAAPPQKTKTSTVSKLYDAAIANPITVGASVAAAIVVIIASICCCRCHRRRRDLHKKLAAHAAAAAAAAAAADVDDIAFDETPTLQLREAVPLDVAPHPPHRSGAPDSTV